MDFTFPKLDEKQATEQTLQLGRTTLNPLMAAATVTHRPALSKGHSGDLLPPPPPSVSRPVVVAAPSEPDSPRQRKKVALEKGYSQVAWLRLTQTAKDLAGREGGRMRRAIPMSEVKQHNTAEDGWVVLRGKVYNITPYLKYHPGGAGILARTAGTDCTALFNKYHAWVNADALLAKCCLGLLEVLPTSRTD